MRSCCVLSSEFHRSGAADADGHQSSEQGCAEQGWQWSRMERQTRQSGTASVSKMRRHISHDSELLALRQDVPKVRRGRSSCERVSIFWRQPGAKGRRHEGRGRQRCRCSQKHVGETGHMSSQCPKKKVHTVDDTASNVSSQDTSAVGSYFDFGCVSEGIPELRCAGAEIYLFCWSPKRVCR